MIRFSSPFVVIFLFRVVILMPSAQLEVAIQACRKAGNFINRESLDLSAIEAREKAPFDFVSRVDTGAQERITSIIRQYFPKDSIVAEESGTIVNPGADGVWYVDPLDGTTNFLHGAAPHRSGQRVRAWAGTFRSCRCGGRENLCRSGLCSCPYGLKRECGRC